MPGIVVISMPQNHNHSCQRASPLERSGFPVIRGHIFVLFAKYIGADDAAEDQMEMRLQLQEVIIEFIA